MSPDGTTIAGLAADGNGLRVELVDLAGAPTRVLGGDNLLFEAVDFVGWEADGHLRVLAQSATTHDRGWLRIDVSNLSIVSNENAAHANYTDAALLPDGRLAVLVLADADKINVIDPVTGTSTPIATLDAAVSGLSSDGVDGNLLVTTDHGLSVVGTDGGAATDHAGRVHVRGVGAGRAECAARHVDDDVEHGRADHDDVGRGALDDDHHGRADAGHRVVTGE